MNILEFAQKSIGEVISAGRLMVPIHQRDYYWEGDQVRALIADFESAVANGADHFLGTIVLTHTAGGFHVVDGQQRMATTMIVLSAIRDIYQRMGETTLAKSIEDEYLFRYDRHKETEVAKLNLNVRDHEFFRTNILLNPDSKPRKTFHPVAGRSNEKLEVARGIIRERLEELTHPLKLPLLKDTLNDWIDFIHQRARILSLIVADDENAFTVFETMNDRGLRVSEADLVKNHLYGKAEQTRLEEVISKWQSVTTLIESIGPKEDMIDYLRIFCTLFYGLTRRRQVFKVVKDNVKTQTATVHFVHRLEDFARDYVAMLNPSSSKWNDYPPSARKHLKTLNDLDVAQIHYLMLAVTHNFSNAEAAKAFAVFVNWIVRFFVAAGDKVGRLEMEYANLAKAIQDGEIKTTGQLADRMIKHLPDDLTFEQNFARLKVSQSKLARYYLDTLERQQMGEDDWELIPDDNTMRVNLEHIIPLNFQAHWKQMSPEMGAALYNRLGNMVLLNAKKNARMGDTVFAEKKGILANSAFRLTQAVAKFHNWGEKEVDERQAALAKIAVKAWPLKLK